MKLEPIADAVAADEADAAPSATAYAAPRGFILGMSFCNMIKAGSGKPSLSLN